MGVRGAPRFLGTEERALASHPNTTNHCRYKRNSEVERQLLGNRPGHETSRDETGHWSRDVSWAGTVLSRHLGTLCLWARDVSRPELSRDLNCLETVS